MKMAGNRWKVGWMYINGYGKTMGKSKIVILMNTIRQKRHRFKEQSWQTKSWGKGSFREVFHTEQSGKASHRIRQGFGTEKTDGRAWEHHKLDWPVQKTHGQIKDDGRS
jgi:hypothetical protein